MTTMRQIIASVVVSGSIVWGLGYLYLLASYR